MRKLLFLLSTALLFSSQTLAMIGSYPTNLAEKFKLDVEGYDEKIYFSLAENYARTGKIEENYKIFDADRYDTFQIDDEKNEQDDIPFKKNHNKDSLKQYYYVRYNEKNLKGGTNSTAIINQYEFDEKERRFTKEITKSIAYRKFIFFTSENIWGKMYTKGSDETIGFVERYRQINNKKPDLNAICKEIHLAHKRRTGNDINVLLYIPKEEGFFFKEED